ncbi:hypothetical protein [uncultured Thiodictyon sp.]|uniref:hypothetical protein n=1 Tax=uncultured Thiodictyon sp. TaxID=1846217 RepID=UPI0025F7CB55|nr:hypothetical protein [uncultured Thiodictyon sp.]
MNDVFADYPVIGRRSAEEKARILRDLGDETGADALLASLPAAQTKAILGVNKNVLQIP